MRLREKIVNGHAAINVFTVNEELPPRSERTRKFCFKRRSVRNALSDPAIVTGRGFSIMCTAWIDTFYVIQSYVRTFRATDGTPGLCQE